MREEGCLSSKTIVITGATSGIGFETAKKLSKQGAFVIGVGRSQLSCRKAEEKIRHICAQAKVVFLVADMSSLRQVRELAQTIKEQVKLKGNGKVDVLINNAGTFSSWYVNTEDGFELQFAVNYLAHFLLTHELLHLIKAAPAGRIITISSGSHYRTRINWKDIMLKKHYNCLRAYKQSKLANVLFTAEINRRLASKSKIRAFAADPGLVNTEIGLKGTNGIARWIWERRRRRGIDADEAAKGIIYLASEPSIQNREEFYWKNCMPKKPSRYSKREDVAHKLWEISERMCGIIT